MNFDRLRATSLSLVASFFLAACGSSTGGGADARATELLDVVFADGRFVTVGTTPGQTDPVTQLTPDTAVIYTSTDGKEWSRTFAGLSVPLFAVAHGNGRFVAVGETYQSPDGSLAPHGAALFSLDGQSWTQGDAPADLPVIGVAFGAGRFVAACATGEVLTSTDGEHWQPSGDTGLENGGVAAVAFGNGVFVVSANSGEVAVSAGGTSWTKVTIASDHDVSRVSFAEGIFHATLRWGCVEDCTGFTDVATSTNGLTWAVTTTNIDAPMGPIVSHDGLLVGSNGNTLVSSGDGVTWALADGLEAAPWNGLAVGGPGVVAVSWGSTAWSTDGVTWSETPIPSN